MTDLHENGAGEHLPQATEIILTNGLRVWVYPITQRDRMALIDAWIKDNPEPDKKAYERPVPEDEASMPGQMLSAESNPAYQELLVERKHSLANYLTNAVLVGYTEFPDHTEAELIQRFARVIARKRKVMAIPTDEWEATVLFALLETPEDQGKIIRAVERRLPVEMGEIIDQVRIFRPVGG